MTPTTLIEQKRALIQAIRVLTANGQHVLAQQLWEVVSDLGKQNVDIH